VKAALGNAELNEELAELDAKLAEVKAKAAVWADRATIRWMTCSMTRKSELVAG
jgi:hypothetical protein